MPPIFCSRLSKLDRYVIKKHKDIYPDESELTSILELVNDTEKSMRMVAEQVSHFVNPRFNQKFPAKYLSLNGQSFRKITSLYFSALCMTLGEKKKMISFYCAPS
jgi:hypothetical protein